eukprot:CAMPEP_0185695526 /NCGR_PEP_ID=MMETSP1164-20130828/4580_1 /TAXON_ID=1104430 /ORGANISM="Chrysoreinhardia sp, Strain CCMP2950" /LENGTH=47 /DNA_ID= /DNA_START= /DNA_END= /DNA_ORIENTATION=
MRDIGLMDLNSKVNCDGQEEANCRGRRHWGESADKVVTKQFLVPLWR